MCPWRVCCAWCAWGAHSGVGGVARVLAMPGVLVGLGGSAVVVVPGVPCVLDAPCKREIPKTHTRRNRH